MLKNLLMNFVRDERGAEGAECGVTNIILAGGAVAGTKDFSDVVKSKLDAVATEVGNSSI
ncbi:MAG: Flp family type IVb pilin [Phycisphaerales bacterium]